ncbi:hypothetical protein D1BOALGB6SA_9195 [Olavius sp. associated proteobacterium Delta 1]|nr:hypothetical protein D1BOALGB6SA_9195 [Olavius sp. associated proteobacterium Delta 1]
MKTIFEILSRNAEVGVMDERGMRKYTRCVSSKSVDGSILKRVKSSIKPIKTIKTGSGN